MSRSSLLAATAALLLAAGARADEPKKEAPPVDPKVEALVKAAVEKAKQELRDELRVETQSAQAAAAFMGTSAEGPKLQFLELDGYLRLRGDLFDNLGFHRGLDANGVYIFPRPLDNPDPRGTQTSGNMRLRLEPTINVSEHVRVRTGIDLLDGYVLGTSGSSTLGGATPSDRPAVNVRRAWGEAETPVGLISFGRMPDSFGMGLVRANFDGIDDDFGDTRDRLQFATLPLPTPFGQLSLVPFYDFDAEGPLQTDPRFGAGVGQPFNLDNKRDGRTLGLKVLRLDTEDEVRRKLERGAASHNYGLLYSYSTLRRVANPFFDSTATSGRASEAFINRREYRHQLDLWYRYKSSRLVIEAEATGLVGEIGDPGPFSATLDYAGPKVLLQQAGGAVRVNYQGPGKVNFGAELGIASGDRAPGFGNVPGQLNADQTSPAFGQLPGYGAFEGPQYGLNGDRAVTNLRFNPGYRVDMILFRELLGQVTDAWYLKPTMRWDILSGLSYEGQVVYSQAIFGSSTPSAGSATSGHRPLGVEWDNKLSYATDDGFHAWLAYGVVFPLDGFRGGGNSLTRAHAIRTGLALKF